MMNRFYILLFIQYFIFGCVYGQNGGCYKSFDSFFLKKYAVAWEREYKKAKIQSTSIDSRQFYDLAYSIDANNTMYLVTKDIKYINRGLEYVSNMLSTAVPSKSLENSSYKDDFLSWPCKSGNNVKKYGNEVPLYESYCWRYVTTLLRIIKNDPRLFSDSKIKNSYEEVLRFSEINIYQKWKSRGVNNLYRSNMHMMSHWGKICMDLYLITGNEEYRSFLNDFVTTSIKNIENYEIGEVKYLAWKLNILKSDSIYQDVSHGNAVVGAIIEIYENKLGFSEDIINRLVNTQNDIIWKSKNEFSYDVKGNGKGSGWFSDGFVKLGRYNKNLQQRFLCHNKGRSTQFLSNIAYNQLILDKTDK